MQPLVIDTNALHDKDFVKFLPTYHGRKILPVIAYIEASIHLRAKKTTEQILELLKVLGVKVEQMTTDQAHGAIEAAIEGRDFADNAHDYLIGSFATSPQHIVVTHNKKDFTFLPDKQVLSPLEVMKKFKP